MGYMGFGMNKWIYTQRPRKFFKSRNIPMFNEIDQIKSEFSPKFANNTNHEEIKRFKAEREKAAWWQNKFEATIVTIIAGIVLAIYSISTYNLFLQSEAYAKNDKIRLEQRLIWEAKQKEQSLL